MSGANINFWAMLATWGAFLVAAVVLYTQRAKDKESWGREVGRMQAEHDSLRTQVEKLEASHEKQSNLISEIASKVASIQATAEASQLLMTRVLATVERLQDRVSEHRSSL